MSVFSSFRFLFFSQLQYIRVRFFFSFLFLCISGGGWCFCVFCLISWGGVYTLHSASYGVWHSVNCSHREMARAIIYLPFFVRLLFKNLLFIFCMEFIPVWSAKVGRSLKFIVYCTLLG